MKRNILKTLLLGCCISLNLPIQGIESKNYEKEFPLSRYVDPRIGSEGLGRVFIGPSCPFGMVKPSRPTHRLRRTGTRIHRTIMSLRHGKTIARLHSFTQQRMATHASTSGWFCSSTRQWNRRWS